MLDAIVGRTIADPAVRRLRYQLFSAIAGTVAAAKRDTAAAAVVVHLINSPYARAEKFAHTRTAVADFCEVVGVDATGPLVGPIKLKKTVGVAPVGMPIWLAVAETSTA